MPTGESWRGRVPASGAATRLSIMLQNDEVFEVDVSYYRVTEFAFVMALEDGSEHTIPLAAIVHVDAQPLNVVVVNDIVEFRMPPPVPRVEPPPARPLVVSITESGSRRRRVVVRGRHHWTAVLKQQTSDGSWSYWLCQGGQSALPEAAAIAWALDAVNALENGQMGATA